MRLNEIYRSYKDQIDFYCAYIKEAHPEDSDGGYRSERNAKLGIVIDQPTTIDERADAAEACVLALNLEMPMLLDDMTNQIEAAYRAWPDRLFVVDTEGRVTFRSAQGPQGFYPEQWEAAIQAVIGAAAAAE